MSRKCRSGCSIPRLRPRKASTHRLRARNGKPIDFTKSIVVCSSYMPPSGFLPALMAFACAAAAQNAASPLSFEAASLKPANQDRDLGSLRAGPGTSSPGQLHGAASLKTLLMRAYRLKDYQIGGPAWMDSERYEIAAKIPGGHAPGGCAPVAVAAGRTLRQIGRAS